MRLVVRRGAEGSGDRGEVRPAMHLRIATGVLEVEDEIPRHHAQSGTVLDGGTVGVGVDVGREDRERLLLVRTGVDEAVGERDGRVALRVVDPHDALGAARPGDELDLDHHAVLGRVDLADALRTQTEHLVHPRHRRTIAEGVVAGTRVGAELAQVDVVVEVRHLRLIGRGIRTATGDEESQESDAQSAPPKKEYDVSLVARLCRRDFGNVQK